MSCHPLVTSLCPRVVWGHCGSGSHQELTWGPNDIRHHLGPLVIVTTDRIFFFFEKRAYLGLKQCQMSFLSPFVLADSAINVMVVAVAGDSSREEGEVAFVIGIHKISTNVTWASSGSCGILICKTFPLRKCQSGYARSDNSNQKPPFRQKPRVSSNFGRNPPSIRW